MVDRKGQSRRPGAIALALLLAACGNEAAPGQRYGDGHGEADGVAGETAAISADSARGTFRVELRPEGGRFPLNEAFALDVAVTDAAGAPLPDGAEVTIDARMPAHGHGMLRDVALERVGPAAYRAEGMLLHMVGRWEVHVDVRRGPFIERAQASVDLEP